MSSRKQLFIDGRTAVHTGSKGCVNAWQMYQQNGTVTPRMNVSKTLDAVLTSTTVSFFDCPAITTAAHIAKSQGDEDTTGGLLNGGLKSEATFFKTGSNQLLIEGNEAVRAFDLCEPNRGNGPLMPVMQAGGAPAGSTLPKFELAENRADEALDRRIITLTVEACQPDNRYGYASVLSTASRADAVLVDPMPIGDKQANTKVPLMLPESTDVLVTLWLLETDKVPAYTQRDREAWPALGKNWASYCPIPLTVSPIATQPGTIDITCISAYPVSQAQTLLPCGWLYLFMEGYLWREFKIVTRAQGMPLYHFSEVNLITQQGRHRREATTQGRMDTILLPSTIQGKAVSMSVAFSETQWPWARIISTGGMHPADRRLLAHRQQTVDTAFVQSDEKPLVQSVTEYPTATLHTQAESPHAVYEGPLLIVPV